MDEEVAVIDAEIEEREPEPETEPATSAPRTGATSASDSGSTSGSAWEYSHGNYILRPPVPARAVLHFLGGALVGAAPHLTYGHLLRRLSTHGYLIVATPYNLSFDHLQTCDNIVGRFEDAAPDLAAEYGPLPVVGVGHSCGALLHVLVTSLFPDTPRAGNVLISFNNKGVRDGAVPGFEEVVVPAIQFLEDGGPADGLKGLELIGEVAKCSLEGEVPPDALLNEIVSFYAAPLPEAVSSAVPSDVSLPPSLRSSLAGAISPLASALRDAGILPALRQGAEIVHQIPPLLREVSAGGATTDFIPPPQSVAAAARRSYRARRTLVLSYAGDPIDESPAILELLRESDGASRAGAEVRGAELEGNHATPLAGPPSLEVAEGLEGTLGEETARKVGGYAGAEETAEEIRRWLDSF